MTLHTGRHFLQIPGPTNVPDRVLRAMDMPAMDHRGAEFAQLGFDVLAGMQRVFRTRQPVIIYPSSGTGAWEAAIVNTLSPGDKVLMAETGQFAVLWRGIADKFKLDVDFLAGDWRRGADVEQIEARLAADRQHRIKAVMVVHNETSTGCVTYPLDVRKAMDRARHPALLMVDTISGLGSLEYEHDAWGIDVSVAGSQKGLMLPPGLGFNAVSEKALAVASANPSMRSYWDWQEVIAINKAGTWPYTPAINLLFGLREAIAMLEEEGLDNVFARHKRHSAATRAAVKAWGLETQCQDPQAHSPALTGAVLPDGHDADNFRKVVLENFDMSLGTGLNKIKGKVFRIGHIGHFNDLMLMATLSGIEMGLDLAKVPHRSGGVLAAMEVLKARGVVPMPKSKAAVA
jgi:alanine-glyoxylate transaminase / serine-glyoxylate transaminase / serine-pyruvate transaminase